MRYQRGISARNGSDERGSAVAYSYVASAMARMANIISGENGAAQQKRRRSKHPESRKCEIASKRKADNGG